MRPLFRCAKCGRLSTVAASYRYRCIKEDTVCLVDCEQKDRTNG